MTDVEIVGLGVWSEAFSDWGSFCSVMQGDRLEASAALAPQVIPARERRRAPASVKMAVEVMDQACQMAALDPSSVATVFASAIGDMQITDYMCRTLATEPRAVSPTRFHNSVHNAATGYWSIATGSHSPASAISGYSNSVWVALLEGAIQAVEEQVPVLVAAQEVAAPVPLDSIYGVRHPFAVALLLAPAGYSAPSLASMQITVSSGRVESPALPEFARDDLAGNYAARSLALLEIIAKGRDAETQFPLSGSKSLSISVAAGYQATQSES